MLPPSLAVAIAAHNFFLNLHCSLYTPFIKLAAVPKQGSKRRGPIPRRSAWATQQVRQNVAAVLSRLATVFDLTVLGNEPKIFRIDSDIDSGAPKPPMLQIPIDI